MVNAMLAGVEPRSAAGERQVYHCRQNALHDGANDVEDITQQPYNDELDRESICAAALEVLYDLRREDDD